MKAFRSAPSAPSRWRRRTPTSSTSAPASPTSAASTPTASACSNPPTPARPGRISVSKPREQIGRVVGRPDQPNRVYVAALGHVYDANPERGALSLHRRRRAPGRRFSSRPTIPNNVGAIDVAIDPKNPRVLYASLWATRRPPWSVYAPSNLPGGGLYKSTDGGDTWKQLDRRPADRRVRRQDRHRGCAQQSQSPVGGGRRYRHRRRPRAAEAAAVAPQPGSRRRSLHLRRRRRHLETGQLREPPVGPRLVLRRRERSIRRIPTAPTSSTPPPT